MEPIRRYRKRQDHPVTAVQLRLDTEGFTYTKWGGLQRCRAGDWLVDNEGDVYTVASEVFARTYRPASRGLYVKITPVWARVANAAGQVKTKEGHSHFEAGDYIVFNDPSGTDAYCMAAASFEAMYEPDE